MVSDSLSTIFIPTRYNQEFLSANKIAFWGDYYANVIVYNFKADSYKKLFETDTYIEGFRTNNNYGYRINLNYKTKNITTKWVFLLVKSKDCNNSKRIDECDLSTLFIATTKGVDLKPLTDENEDVISFDIFEAQGIALVKIQIDTDNDKSFKNESVYFKKIDLLNLSIGKEIILR
jgi:hypothetical protein